MSDNFLYIFPTDPLFHPDRAAIYRALARLREVFPARDIRPNHVYAVESDVPEYICCLGNMETVRCPACGARILDGWGQMMAEWMDRPRLGRRDLSVVTPCCGTATDLNALDYIGPQGYSCFYICIDNPGFANNKDLDELAAILGTPLREVWAHL